MRNLKKYIFIGMTALLATSCQHLADSGRRRQVPRWLLQQLAGPVQLRLGLGWFPPVLGWYK